MAISSSLPAKNFLQKFLQLATMRSVYRITVLKMKDVKIQSNKAMPKWWQIAENMPQIFPKANEEQTRTRGFKTGQAAPLKGRVGASYT